MKQQKIVHHDDYKIFDELEKQKSRFPKSGPIGFVRLFSQRKLGEERTLLYEGNNLVVGLGRQFVAQKIFNATDGTSADYRDYAISHFAIGAGGASVSGDDVVFLGPHVCDTHLYKPISLNSTNNEPGAYDNSAVPDEQKAIYNSYGAVKPIDRITFVEESFEESNQSCTYNSKVKCECIIGAGEPPMLAVNGYVPVSEAGLYFVSGTDVKMFAHICFPPKYTELESVLTIDWYIIC